jgi:hypothetical protein
MSNWILILIFKTIGWEDGCATFPRNSIATRMPVWYHMVMKRTALFLKETQLKKLKALSDRTGAPVAELIRRAIDKYLQERAKELK